MMPYVVKALCPRPECGHPLQIDDGEVLPCAEEYAPNNGPWLRFSHPGDRPQASFTAPTDHDLLAAEMLANRAIREYRLVMAYGHVARPAIWERTR